MIPLELHPDRFFDADVTVRGIARDLYATTYDLPIVSPHGHVEPRLLADDAPFPEPTELFLTPDHYIFRMLHSQGVSLDDLGIPRADGSRAHVAPRLAWQRFAERYYLFAGTPTRAWMDYALYHVFGVREVLTAESGQRIYDHLAERLQDPSFRPRALFDRFQIEVLTTTDAATDDLRSHAAIRASGWGGAVRPCFRPDALFRIAAPTWSQALSLLTAVVGFEVTSFKSFIEALEVRRAFFKAAGAFATDHAAPTPYTGWLTPTDAEMLFQRARAGQATADDERRFIGHLFLEMARMSTEDGLVMQLHCGAHKDHSTPIFERFGQDKGGDIPRQAEFTENLRPLLNAFGHDPRLRLIVFTLDETTYARELAPLAGFYPAMLVGPAWWFHDSIEGMTRYRERITETAGFYNTAGFNDDTRAFCSIPARHDLSRRVDANCLARLVARHILSRSEAETLARALAYDLARAAYRLDAAGVPSKVAVSV